MASAFQFSNPADYSDWAKYAGFDRKTGDIGVAPPSAPSVDDIENKISNITSQLQQGNVVGSVKALVGTPPVVTPTTPTYGQPLTPQTTNAVNYNPFWH